MNNSLDNQINGITFTDMIDMEKRKRTRFFIIEYLNNFLRCSTFNLNTLNTNTLNLNKKLAIKHHKGNKQHLQLV